MASSRLRGGGAAPRRGGNCHRPWYVSLELFFMFVMYICITYLFHSSLCLTHYEHTDVLSIAEWIN